MHYLENDMRYKVVICIELYLRQRLTCFIIMEHSFPYNNVIRSNALQVHLYKYGQLVYLNISIYTCLFITPGASAYSVS